MVVSLFFNNISSTLTNQQSSVSNGKSPNVIHHDFFLLRNWYSVWRTAQMFAGAPFVVVLIIFCCIIALRLCIKNQLSSRSNKKRPLQLRQMKRPRKLQQSFMGFIQIFTSMQSFVKKKTASVLISFFPFSVT